MAQYQMIKDREFEWPVTVNVPNKDGGGDKFTFTATFVARDLNSVPSQLADGISAHEAKVEILRGILAGWDGLQDETGKPLEFSDASIDAVARDVFLHKAIFAAYRTATSAEMQRNN